MGAEDVEDPSVVYGVAVPVRDVRSQGEVRGALGPDGQPRQRGPCGTFCPLGAGLASPPHVTLG